MENKTKNSSLLDRWKNREEKMVVAPLIPKAPVDSTIPLSSGQQRIWFLQQLYPENPFYNYSESLAFEGNLNVDYLKKSVRQLVVDNEILRSFYPVVDGQPILKISENIPDIAEFDLSKLTEDKAAAKIEQIRRRQATSVFDLASPGLIKVALFKRDTNKYTLFFTMHHIIIDEWSIGILKEKLAENYRRLSDGLELEPSNPVVQYTDYAHWQRNKSIDKLQLEYWKEVLSDDIPILNLQTDFNRPVRPSFRGKQYTKALSSKLSSDIFELSKKLETTPFVFLLSVYYVMLHRYSRQKDILIGTPVSNRSVKSLESVLGFFIDTLVLRNEVDKAQSFSEMVKNVKKSTLEAFSHKDVPFDTLVKELKVERSLSINPFFQVMFLYHPESKFPFFGNEVRLTDQAEFDTKVAKFDLTLSISESRGQLLLTFEYDTDLFEEATIARLIEHYRILLMGIVENPDVSIAELPMLTENEKRTFLEKPTSKSHHFASYEAIHHIIDEVCETHAKDTAVTYKNQSITYENLNDKANALALAINEKTKKQNEIVGLCLDRSIDMIVAMLAILKAGCAYLPIDPKYPSERLNFILADAECDVIVTDSMLVDLFKDLSKNLILTDKFDKTAIPTKIELPKVNEEDLAYVIYTSGSTGQPKGVPISHKNIISSTAGRLDFYPNNPDTFLLMSSISFDSSKAGIFWTLCTGGNLLIAENRIEQDVHKIELLIENHGVSHTLMLPSLYKLILEHSTSSKLACLNTVMVAGEACTTFLSDLHFEKLPTASLYNEYGPTEATVWCIAHQIKKNDNSRAVPIGKNVANAEIYLLDEDLSLTPYGAVGEIYIGGPGLAKGYINRPELSEKAFIENPYGKDNEKIYKTGDLGRYRKDGAIEFLGRADQQIKIRGFRVELEEIEKAISHFETISKAVVLVEDSKKNGKTIDIDDLSDPVKITKYLKDNLSDKELAELLGDFELPKNQVISQIEQPVK